MFFAIDSDVGHAITGWIAPDNPATSARLVVYAPDSDRQAQLTANLPRPDVRDLGIHNTGEVGFRVDDALLSGLADESSVIILDAETEMQIYGRHQPERHVPRKLFLFDPSAMPAHGLLTSVRSYFSLNNVLSERFSFETMIVLLNNTFSNSVFISGRSNFLRYSGYLEQNNYICAALLQDPFVETAERLFLMQLLASKDSNRLGGTFGSGLESLLEFTRELDLTDVKALTKAFRHATPEQISALSNPVTRMFGCTPDEMASRRHVSTALNSLGHIHLVGLRSRYAAFRNHLDAHLGFNVTPMELKPFADVSALAEKLKKIGLVADFLDADLLLYSLAEHALESVLDKTGPLVQARDTQTR